MSSGTTPSLARAESPSKAEEKPVRLGTKAQPNAEIPAKNALQFNSSMKSTKNQRYVNPATGGKDANPAAPTDFAASSSSEAAAQAHINWAELTKDSNSEYEGNFTVVQKRKRRRGSANSSPAAAPSSNLGGARTNRRPQSSAGWAPRAQEVRTTRAHIVEARARQASSTEDHCDYIERSPELEPYHYMRALDRMLGGTREVFQMTKMNGHFLVGLANRCLAERLVNEGLEVEGTLHRAFPFRKRAERITVGNLPFFVGDAAVISALSTFGRVTSIAPKLMKAGPYVYNDGRREALIILREGMTIERLPTRLDISIKGEAWPAYLSSGIRCSRCRGQGHRKANCPMLAGRTTAPGPATPTSPSSVPPATAPRLPQQPSAQPPPPASPSSTMEVSDVPPASRAAPLPPAALQPSPPAPSALHVEDAPPAPSPVTPAPSLRTPGSREPAAQTPDVEMSIAEETSASSTSSAKNATRVDLDAFIEKHPSVSFAGTDALGLGREEVLDLLSSRTKAQRKGPLLSPLQCDALAGLIGKILDLRPGAASNLYKVLGQVKAELRTTPAVPPTPTLPAPWPAKLTPPALHGEKTSPDIATPPPPLSTEFIDSCYDQANDIIYELSRERYSEPLSDIGVTEGDIVEAIIFPVDREPLFRRLSTQKRTILTEIIGAAIERARNSDPFVHQCGNNSKKRFADQFLDEFKRKSKLCKSARRQPGCKFCRAGRPLAAIPTSNAAAQVRRNWADITEEVNPGAEEGFTLVQGRKRRRGSANSPTAAAPSSNAGGSRTIRRPQPSAGSVPRAQEIRVTRAHIAEARARQASFSEEHCVYIEHSPELEPFHYLKALDRMLGGTAGVIQITKVNGHQLLGLTNRGLAERLISEGLEVEGTLLRAFPIRKRAERITVGNLPFFVGDSAVINALSPYGRVTSIAPKQMKAGPYVYVDGRRDIFITLHEGITIERLPTRLDIHIKGKIWPAYLSSGIRCSKCHGQGHRRAICPLLAGLANNTRMAPPTTPAGVPPPTTSAPPQRSAAQPPAPTPSNPAMEVCSAPPVARAVLHSSAPRPSPPAAPAFPMEETPPAPPPVTPAPSLRTPGSREPAAPTPDVEMPIEEETFASSTSSAKNATRVDLDAFIEGHPSVSFAKTDALGLGRVEVLDLLSSRTKTQRKGPLLSPPQCDALAGLIRQILNLRPGAATDMEEDDPITEEERCAPPPPAPRLAGPIPPVPHGDTTTPAMTTPPPPLSLDRRWKMAGDLIHELSREIDLEHTFQSQVDMDDIVRAVLYPGDREPFIKRLPTRDRHVNPATGGKDANPAAPTDFAASSSSEAAAQAHINWAELTEDSNSEYEGNFTVVQKRKRRRGSANSSPAAAPSSNLGGARTNRRPQSSAGWAPRAQEVRTTRAHIVEARARQASSTEDHCVYIEHSPELEPYHYMRALDRMLGGTREVFQMTKMNGHFLVGLANRCLAERLVNEGLEVEGTLHRAFPFRKRAERITVGNLPFFVGDAAVISALSTFGRVTSIAPKLMKAGPYVYNDGRREALIILREGMTIERLPTRLDISIKGEAWPAYLSSGIRCSRCRGQGHRRANCPMLAGRTTAPGPATPTSPSSVPPATAPRLPQQPSAQPPPPASPSSTMEVSDVPPASRAAPLPPAALQPSPPAPSALHVEDAPPAPPPVTPAPSLRTPGSREPAAQTPDVEMSIAEETSASSTSSAKNATRVDLDAFIEKHPSVSFAGTDALGLGREVVLDLLSSRTKAQRKGPLLSPLQCDALAGLIGQILDLRPGAASNLYKVLGQVKAELRTTPAVPPTPTLPGPWPAKPTPPALHAEKTSPDIATPPPPLSTEFIDSCYDQANDIIYELSRERYSEPLSDIGVTEGDIVEAIIFPVDREPLFRRLSTQKRTILTEIIGAVIERARNSDPFVRSSGSAGQEPGRPSIPSPTGGKKSTKNDSLREIYKENYISREYVNPPADGGNANLAAARVDVISGVAATSSSNGAALAIRNWADCDQVVNPGTDDDFTVVKTKKRRRESSNSPTAATPSSNSGRTRSGRRVQSSARSVPRAQEIPTTRAHITEARARQASSSEEHCVYLEHGPELQPFHYLRALDRLLGGTAGVVQVSKVNGHQLLGLANRGLAERLINNGLEVEGTLLRAFPFRKRAERITVSNLPFFVEDSAIINALRPFGRITSIAPKMMKAGPYTYTDGRREAFIVLHEGMTTERLPTRLNITIKGEAWPAYLSTGIKCSRCHGQGHRRANCPLLAGLANNTRTAPPTTPAGVPPPTTPAPPQRSAAQLPAPTPSNPAMEVCSAPPVARAALHSSAPRPSPPAAPAFPMEDTPPAPPPVTLLRPCEHLGVASLRPQHRTWRCPSWRRPLRPPRHRQKNATRVDLDAFIEGHPSVSFAKTDALGLGREVVLDLLSSRTKAQRKGPLLSPPQCDALVGLIGQILDLRPGAASNLYKVLGQVKAELRTTPAVPPTPPLPAPRPAEPMLPTTHREELTPPLMTPPPPAPTDMEEDDPITEEERCAPPPPAPRLAGPIPPVPHGDTTTPAMTTPPPPLSMDRRWKIAGDFIHDLSREIDLEHTFQSQVDMDDIVRAVLYPGDREPFIKRLPTRDRYILGGFIGTAIWRARDADPSMLESMSELRKLLPD
ncbi:hypothetical protein LAZ67_1005912 [Cordylochernes scorpioides]|uniref:CCHC-type domain-containing protein n=1 Tax=Cordylochernes scorpioides TaxID=51811 RepID=A0ABY6K1I1_9ARAC|nr:hypothetical protein LAZ67_1005912 [Cordylochernes scorpioides]